MRSGRVYERPMSAPRTSANAGSCLPGLLATPTAWLGRREAHSIGDPQRWTNPDRSNELSDQIAYLLLPTPLASMQGPSRKEIEAGNPRHRLEAAVALLPMPRATDGTNGGPNQRESSGDLMLPSTVTQLLPTPRASDTGTPGRRASEGFRPPLSQVLQPTPTATPYGNNQSPSSGAAVRPSLDSLASSGAFTDPPSTAGRTSSDAPHPVQLTIEDALTPDSSNG